MRFEYSPATPDDWPDVIAVSVSEVDGEHGFEEGDVRCYEPNWKHRVAGNTIREQRGEIHELQGFFKQCANRYADVFAACGMEAPAIFTPEQHEELLANIAGLRAAEAMVEEQCRETANGALEMQAAINGGLLKRIVELETLAQDMFRMLRNEGIDGYMRMVDGKPEFHNYADRMREAGIEVSR